MADPTPPAPPSALTGEGLRAWLQRWTDALRFRWDRYVVRFSDQDQQEGLAWLQARAEALPAQLPSPRTALPALAALGILLAGAWALRIALRPPTPPLGHGRVLKALGPLIRAAGREQAPQARETVRTWLQRQAILRPRRQTALEALIREAEAVAYNGQPDRRLRRLATEERAAWRRG